MASKAQDPVAANAASRSGSPSDQAVDIGDLLDNGTWTTFQKIVVVLSALAITFEGFDGQLIGYAIPAMVKDLGFTKTQLAPVAAMGLVGMAIGMMVAGWVADRFGRRLAVVGSVLVFAIGTLGIGFVSSIDALIFLRLIAGIGSGAALPTATVLAGEFTPLRYRAMAVTATIVCVPLGGMLAGLIAAEILGAFGWRGLFQFGGALPLVLFVVLLAFLPESPRWMVRMPSRWPALGRLLARMGRQVSAPARYVDVAEQKSEHGNNFRALFTDGRASSTAMLWLAFFMTSLGIYLSFNWLPTMLSSSGLSLGTASAGLMVYNLGGVLGALSCGATIAHFGSRWPMTVFAIGAAISALLVNLVDFKTQTDLMLIALGAHGLFINAVMSTMYALAGNLYPTKARATGTAAGLTVGRVGAFLSSFAGAALIEWGGAMAFLDCLALTMGIATIALVLVRRHIPAAQRNVSH